MDVKCCKCKKEYDLASNIFEYKKDANCPILICPYCGFKHIINFMPFEKRIKVKKIKKIDLAFTVVILGASRIADANRVDKSGADDADIGYWGVITATYMNLYKSVNAEDTEPYGIAFSSDGTKMYMLGNTNKSVFQYTLSEAWNISTAIYASLYKAVNNEETYPRGIAFSSDGTKMYIVGYDTDNVYQYTLSTAWNVSTATYSDLFKSVTTEDETPMGITFSADGTKMYMVGYVNKTVFQYTLSTAWNVSTAVYASLFKSVNAQDTYPYDVAFSSDGTKMYINGNTNNKVFQYTLSEAWNVSTAVYSDLFKSVTAQDATPTGIAFSSDGAKMYILGYINKTVFQYTFSWLKTNDFILATRIYTSKGPLARAYKLRWRDVTDEGVFADVGATGEISYNATTDLTDDGDLLIGEKLCSVQTDYTWQNGLESEGDNLLPNAGTYSLADEYYTEFQWALDCNNAEDEHEYEFELWDVTEGVSIGTCLASIILGITPSGFKWNTKTILNWCTKVISKWNDLE